MSKVMNNTKVATTNKGVTVAKNLQEVNVVQNEHVKQLTGIDVVKNELVEMKEKYNVLYKELKSRLSVLKSSKNTDKSAIKLVEKQLRDISKEKDKKELEILQRNHVSLLHLVNYLQRTLGGVKVTSAFAVLSKMNSTTIVKAGLNGRRYTLKDVRKAFKILQSDKDNAVLNESKGQKISRIINECYASNNVPTFLQSLIDAKVIDLEKCSKTVAIAICQQNRLNKAGNIEYLTTTNERIIDIYEAFKVELSEKSKKKDIQIALWELFETGEIEILSESVEV